MEDTEFKIKVLENLSKINEQFQHVSTKEELGKVKGLTKENKARLDNHRWVLGTLFTGFMTVLVTIFTKAIK